MIRAPLSTTAVLDESAEVVRMTAAPWAGILILASMPYRFLQMLFLDRVLELGGTATQYGDVLRSTAYWTAAAFVLSLCGRAVYARACRLAVSGGSPGSEALRVRPAALLNYIYVASLAEVITYMTVITFVGPIAGVMLSGLAIGTMELNERVSLTAPLRLIGRYTRVAMLFGLVFVFFCAFIVALVNLTAAFQLVVWASGAFGGFDAPRWQLLFTGSNRRYTLLLIAGALVAVEPFWIAAQVVFVRKAGAEERGDDLRAWFEELRRAS